VFIDSAICLLNKVWLVGCRSLARDISDPAADAAALQPLTGRRAMQLGLTHLANDSLQANMPLPKNKPAEV